MFSQEELENKPRKMNSVFLPLLQIMPFSAKGGV
jgi:hypothetical protein